MISPYSRDDMTLMLLEATLKLLGLTSYQKAHHSKSWHWNRKWAHENTPQKKRKKEPIEMNWEQDKPFAFWMWIQRKTEKRREHKPVWCTSRGWTWLQHSEQLSHSQSQTLSPKCPREIPSAQRDHCPELTQLGSKQCHTLSPYSKRKGIGEELQMFLNWRSTFPVSNESMWHQLDIIWLLKLKLIIKGPKLHSFPG